MVISKKKCPSCNKITNNYQTCNSNPTGLQVYCRPCQQEKVKNCDSTIYRIYKGHLRSEQVGYNLDELKLFLKQETDFVTLYNEYKKSNYNKLLCPCVTKIDIRLSYRIDNIQVVVKENLIYKRLFDAFVIHPNLRLVKVFGGYTVRVHEKGKSKIKFFSKYEDAYNFQVEQYIKLKETLNEKKIKYVEPLTLSCYYAS